MSAERLVNNLAENINKITILAGGEYVIIPLEQYNELIDTISLYQNGTMDLLVECIKEPSEKIIQRGKKINPWVK